jgi:hypothetical protein
METATTERLGEVRRRIARLEVQAQRATAEATARMQRYIDTLRYEEESARASARERAAAVDGRLEQLDNELELAEHRVAAEFAPTKAQFAGAIEAELHLWDTYLARMQTRAATKSGAAREQAEAAIAELRQRRVSVDKSLSDVGTAAGNGWRGAKTRVLAELDDLKSKADTASRG